MSDPISLAPRAAALPAATPARAAIAEAAERTGVDFQYLLAQAKIESAMNPQARARTSSAGGLYQFIDSTWLATLDKHGDAYGFGAVSAAIDQRGGRSRVSDPAQRQAILALKMDPRASALMAGALANDNRASLNASLGREPDGAELYLAHFLGADGAARVLGTLATAPDTPAAAILPAAAAANRAIFYAPGGSARSVDAVMQLVRGKLAAAQDSGAMPGGSGAGGYPPASPFEQAAARFQTASAPNFHARGAMTGTGPLAAPAAPRASSMAETLRASFGTAGGALSDRSRQHVAGAYARLQAFDL